MYNMNYDDIKIYREPIIRPLEELPSDKTLAEIEGFYKEYYFSSFDEEPDILSKEYKGFRKFKLYDVLNYIMEKNGFTVHKIEDDDDNFNL